MGGTVKTSGSPRIGLPISLRVSLLVGVMVVAFLPPESAETSTGHAAGGGELDHIELRPEKAKLPSGHRQTFQVKAFDASGKNLPGVDVQWKYSGIAGSFGLPGEFVAERTGQGTVTAMVSLEDRTIEATAAVEVFDESTDVKIASITLEPARLELVVGEDATMTPVVMDSGGDQLTAGVGLTWTVEGGIGTVDPAGGFHATAPGIGWVEVEGKLFGGSARGKAEVTVREPAPPGEPTDPGGTRSGPGLDLLSGMATLGLVALLASASSLAVVVGMRRRRAKLASPTLVPNSVPLTDAAPLSLPEDRIPPFDAAPRPQSTALADGSPDLPLLPLIDEEYGGR